MGLYVFHAWYDNISKQVPLVVFNRCLYSDVLLKYSESTFYFSMIYLFIFNLSWWHWLIRLYTFQVYISVIHVLCIHCVPTTQSQIILPHHTFDPFTFYYSSTSLPSGIHHTVVCVSEFQFYSPQMSEIIWFLAFSNGLILPSIIFSRSIHAVANGSISSFLITE